MKLEELQTPALLLDKKILETNCQWFKDKAKKLGITLRPHLKTGKCKEFALLQMESPEGPATVSTLLEAEKFAEWGVKDMIYAVGLAPGKFARVAALRRKGIDLKVILDNVRAAQLLSEFCAKEKIEIPVLIEIDCDGHRSGVKEGSPVLLEVAQALRGGAKLVGLLTHAGDSYSCVGADECRKAQENERDTLVHCAEVLRGAGYKLPIISAGSTPTAVFAEDWKGVTEVRCGVGSTYDLVMVGIGVCKVEDIAISLLVEVIGHQEEKGWVITDGGWMATSRDRGTADQKIDQGYGLVCDINGKPIEDFIVSSANQEHGIITKRGGGKIDPKRFPVGTRFRILPNHACAMAAQHPCYNVIENGEAVEVWDRFYGW